MMRSPGNRLSPNQQEVILQVLAPFDCAAIYIFGSAGRATERPDSDIDIAFLSSRITPPLDCFHLANTLADRLGRPVDLIDLQQASTVMAKEVLRTGTPILIAAPLRQQEFEMRVLSDYARLNEERQPVLIS